MKIIHWFIYIFLLLSTLLVGYIWYSLIFPLDIIKPRTQPYKVLTPVVHSGGELVYVVDACKIMETTAVASRSFIDGVVFSLPSTTANIKKGCFKTNMSVTVPKQISSGTWHLQIDIEYKVNTFRTKTYHFKTENFQVINDCFVTECKK